MESSTEVKRILHIIGTMNRGGAETFIMNIFRNIERSRLKFDFLIHTKRRCDYDDEIESLGGIIHRVARKSSNPAKNLYDTYIAIKGGQYDMVHVHSSISIVFFDLLMAKLAGVKVRIIHSHSTSRKGLHWNLLQKIGRPLILLFATDKWACSAKAAEWMYGKKYADKAQIINNCIDAKMFSYNEAIAANMKKELGIKDKFVVGHVGRFASVKNHEFLIDVFEKIYETAPDSILLLVGKGDTLARIQAKVKEKGLSEAVIFLGIRNDIEKVMQAMDVFVFPSFYEGFPVVLIEAQAAGLKVIAADSITREVNITGQVEFISLDEPVEKWAKTILDYQNAKRKNTFEIINDSPFEVKRVVKSLSDFYLDTSAH